MSLLIKVFAILFFLVFSSVNFAADNEHDDHKEYQDHKDEHDGDQHEEENSKVGADKGILKADKNLGFILSPEAMKNFVIKTFTIQSSGPWNVPLKAKVISKDEVNLFRLRKGFIKRIDFTNLSTDREFMKVQTSELTNGDQLIIDGVGFVRIAEITAFGGAAEGHSH